LRFPLFPLFIHMSDHRPVLVSDFRLLKICYGFRWRHKTIYLNSIDLRVCRTNILCSEECSYLPPRSFQTHNTFTSALNKLSLMTSEKKCSKYRKQQDPIKTNRVVSGPEIWAAKISVQHDQPTDSRNADESKSQPDDQNVMALHGTELTSRGIFSNKSVISSVTKWR
jgi:hypothetical protein